MPDRSGGEGRMVRRPGVEAAAAAAACQWGGVRGEVDGIATRGPRDGLASWAGGLLGAVASLS